MCYIKLEGLDKDWILVDNTPRISYSNLRPGNYKLRIKSSNSTWGMERNLLLWIFVFFHLGGRVHGLIPFMEHFY